MAGPEEGPRLVWVGVLSMVAICAVGLGWGYQFMIPEIDEVGYPLGLGPQALDDGTIQVTVDARSEEEWVAFSFELGQIVPEGAAADVRLRRHYWRTSAGAAEVGGTNLVTAALPSDIEWQEDVLDDGLLLNEVLLRWYDYSYWTHLLSSDHRVYAVRLRNDPSRAALIRIESYYCAPEGSGCMTFRYRLVDVG
jgi:hypothetical protein